MNLILKSFILLVFVLSEIAFGSFVDGTSRYSVNMKGNMKVIGNTVLCPKNASGQCIETTLSNADVDLRYYDVDGNTANTTFNSSSATLVDPNITDPTKAKIKKAYLYWSGQLHIFDLGDGTQTQYQTLKKSTDVANAINNAKTVQLTIPGSTTSISVTGIKLGDDGQNYGYMADVTTGILENKTPLGEYTVANVPCMEGKTSAGRIGNGTGNSGAWTLVIIYENDSVGEKTRNITVFDGFERVYNNTITLNVAGFKTPKAGDVDSTLSVFANEGDIAYNDKFTFKNIDGDKAGIALSLSGSSGSSNFFNSTITGVDTRTPKVGNNNGIDIHTDQMGTSGYDIVSTNQTAAQISLTSSGDLYFPVMVAFATELYKPKLCYDYSVLLDDEMMQRASGVRTYIPHKNEGNLTSKIFIRSLEGDYPYVKSSLRSYWSDITVPKPTTSPTFSFINALVQNPDIYAYEEPIYINNSIGQYYIGNKGTEGVIDPYKSLYAISNISSKDIYGKTLKLDVDVNASLQLDDTNKSKLTTYLYSTSNGSLEICTGNTAYNPKWYQFNVEKLNASDGDYALNTQVTGSDYNIQVASYTKDSAGEYTFRTPYTGAIEVELFEIPSFQSLSSYDTIKYSFDRICEDSSNGKPWADNKKHFSLFTDTQTTPLGITKEDNKYAMRNAGVRIWTLTDGNNTLITHDGIHFHTLYNNTTQYKNDIRLAPACTTGTEEACYEVLKKYYGKPTCSRDNFSVRPYGIALDAVTTARDADGKITKEANIAKNETVPATPPIISNLVSGLDNDYETRLTAKSANNQVNPTGYYFRKFATDARDVLNSKFDELREFFGLKFDNSKINDTNKDITKCDDSTHKRFDPTMSSWKLENHNVGNYDILLLDRNWTMVDQKEYKYKALASAGKDDCIPSNTELYNSSSKLSGCDVQSFNVNNDIKFNKIPVKFVPAKIDVQTIAKPTRAWSYMNDLTDPNTSLDISAKFAGNIVAQNALNALTTNFTAGCFAQDVDLNMNYSSSDLDKDGNAVTNNKFGIQYAQALNNTNTIQNTPFITDLSTKTDPETVDRTLNLRTRVATIGLPVTPAISKNEFLDSNKGSIAYDLRISIRKILDAVINPIEMLFLDLKSKLYNSDGTPTEVYKLGYTPSDLKTAGLEPNIVDNKNYYRNDTSKSLADQLIDRLNNSYAFIYGAVYTPLMSGATQSIATLTRDVVLSVVGYCDADCDKYSKAPYLAFESTNSANPANGTSKPTTPNWYRMVAHDKDNDGEIIKISSNSALATIDGGATKANVKFDKAPIPNAGNTQDITLGYPTNGRDKLVEYTITPSAWLAYKIATVGAGTNPLFMINWINPVFNWTGKGANVGSAVQMTPQPSTKRLSW